MLCAQSCERRKDFASNTNVSRTFLIDFGRVLKTPYSIKHVNLLYFFWFHLCNLIISCKQIGKLVLMYIDDFPVSICLIFFASNITGWRAFSHVCLELNLHRRWQKQYFEVLSTTKIDFSQINLVKSISINLYHFVSICIMCYVWSNCIHNK